VWLVQTDLQTSNGFPRIRIMCPTGCLGWPVSLNGQMFTAAEIAFELPGSGVALASGLNLTLFSLRATGGTLPFSGITVNSTIPNVAVGPGAAVAMDAAKLFPNPATDAVRVVFAVPRSATAQVTVIDLAGRQVRSLANRSFAAGAHELRWDGRDDGGREAPAGMYFVRVRSAAGESTARLSRLW
jgi:hypothetical protein